MPTRFALLGQAVRLALMLPLALPALLAAPGPAQAQTLRWATRGDAQSMDPYTFNEGLTSNINLLVYDTLVERDKQQRIVPHLAASWRVVNPTTWRLSLREGVKFHDGSVMTSDDVVFSIERSQQPTSQLAVYTRNLGQAVAIDRHTVELRLKSPNPLLLETLPNIFVMSRAWCIAHKVERVPSFTAKEEAYSSRNAMGTGRYLLKQRQPGVRTVFARHPAWWGRNEGNVAEVVLTPIASDATRTAALLGGDINFTTDTPTQDVARLSQDPAVRLTTGPENRIMFFGFDQHRDELQYSSVKGKNPFKDVRVREAFFLATDAAALKASIMRGQSVPTACMTTAAIGCLAPELETRPPADLVRARRLMAEAGYADGFELKLDCTNDRYINDQALCVAMVGLLSKIGVKLTVDARSKTLFFPKVDAYDTSFYFLGWGGSVTDAQTVMDTQLHSLIQAGQKGESNNGRFSDPEMDRWIDAAGIEMDPAKRSALIASVLRRNFSRYYTLPLHRPMLTWASRANVKPVITPSNQVRVDWIVIEPPLASDTLR